MYVKFGDDLFVWFLKMCVEIYICVYVIVIYKGIVYIIVLIEGMVFFCVF